MENSIEYVNGEIVRTTVFSWSQPTTATLRWCQKHCEPAWVYYDGSVECPYDYMVESRNEHDIVPLPKNQESE